MSEPGRVVVAGAALMDLLAHARVPIIAATSNPARVHTTPGGVGRNIAENLARLGSTVSLLAVVGPDAFGDAILASAQSAGIDTSAMITGPEPTGTYLAVLDQRGELHVALSDLAATESLSVAAVEPAQGLLRQAALLVIDGNLPGPVLAWLLDCAAEADLPVVLDPVSVVKAARLARVLSADRPVHVLTPNLDELTALRAALDLGPGDPLPGVANLWVRRGADGSSLAAGDGAATELPAPTTTVVDVTGAGDAGTAGLVHALLRGAPLVEAATYGQVASALTVASAHTVRPDLSDELVRSTLAAQPQESR